ncbi:Phage tail protein [compost metagenome]
MSTRLSIDFPVVVTFESKTEMSASLTREIPFAAEIETATEMLAQMIRERVLLVGPIESATEFVVKVTHAHVDEITFNGGFKPGDVLVIDTRKQTITLNGENVIDKMGGDFFDLIYGANKLTYTDSEAARMIRTRITHRDKYLY